MIRPSATWRDLVLKAPRLQQLEDAVARLRHQPRVIDDWKFLANRRGARGVRLKLSSLGNPDTRREYLDELRDYLRAHEDELSDEVRRRLDVNPLRAFDADHPQRKTGCFAAH